MRFLTSSKKFHDYEHRNLEGKLCFWLMFPFWLLKYIRILYFDSNARQYKKAIKKLEK